MKLPRIIPLAAAAFVAGDAWTKTAAAREAPTTLDSAPPTGKGAAATSDARRVSIIDFKAVGDDRTINTKFVQAAIDQAAGQGGGTVIIPAGVFVSGAIFLKPGVNLHFEKGAVLKASTDMKNFPEQRTRIEGHFEPSFNPALLNADGCDGLRITGEGTLDGAGRPIWDLFWKKRSAVAAKINFKNLSVPRARLCLIENSTDVLIAGITFKDSQFWNLHLYKNRRVTVRNARFQVPDDYKQAPSSDGIDVDSCQDVAIEGCTFSVTDDCIAMKGSKGPDAPEDKDSPPVERVRVRDCVFERGHAALTLGSEATVVRDVVMENCQVNGAMPVLNLKLRPDTPQHYEDIHVRNITGDNAQAIITVRPWTQYFDLKGRQPPQSTVRNVTLSDLKGSFGSLGTIEGNPGQTTISDITFENIDMDAKRPKLDVEGVTNLRFKNVTVDGQPWPPADTR